MNDVKHVSWQMENGAPSRIGALGQSRDGYLWIGSVEGLFRFDGAAFEKIRPEHWRGGPFVVSAILGASSGDVWVGLGRSGGAMIYRAGRLLDTHMPNPSREVVGMAETRNGAVWVARGGRIVDTLALYRNGRWERAGADWGLPTQRAWQLLVARDGALWIVLNDRVMRLAPGARRFEKTGGYVTWRANIAEDASGRMWVSDGNGTRPLDLQAQKGPSAASGHSPRRRSSTTIRFDGKGRLWGTTPAEGLFRMDAPHDPGSANRRAVSQSRKWFTDADGMTSDQARSLFVDREGNVWAGTELGLDMLRDADVNVETAIPANSAESYHIAVADEGTVYVTDADTLYRIRAGRSPEKVLRTATNPATLCPARDGGVWLTLRDRLLRVTADRVERFAKPINSTYYGCAEDRDGRLWLPAVDAGLLWRQKSGAWQSWPGFRAGVGVPGDVALDARGKAAILFRNRPPTLKGAPFISVVKERLRVGNLESLLPGRRLLMVGGAQGLAALTEGRVLTLSAKEYPWVGSINGLVQTVSGDTWTIGDAGIVRMRTAALDAAFKAPGVPLPRRIFDFNDGVNSFAQKASGPQAVAGGDGRLWFLTRRNVLTVDPRRLERNSMAPSVSIRSLIVGDRHFRDPLNIELPGGTTTLAINYTATSLTVPSRVRFRYRLEGADANWIDAQNRRAASYSDLGPGTYRFRVIASNNDGVWNRDGADVRFTILPTLVQTWPFRLAVLAAFGLLLWILYSLRLRQVSAQIRGRTEARSAERERIARELHDTLLQGMQGLIMRFHAIGEHLSESDPTRTSIDQTLDRADDLLMEGRERVRDLRKTHDACLEALLRELADAQPFDPSTKVQVVSNGNARPINGPIAEEVGRIAGEAMFNAARHAEADRVEVRADYGRKRLVVTILDNGIGFDGDGPRRAQQQGHYGMLGMHERAGRIGARVDIVGRLGQGTTVVVTIPASLAYRSEAGSHSNPFGRLWYFLTKGSQARPV
ncbi:triple tyrosine motif-containing protein [Sphingomonas sp. R86521]|uniref:sensor histidine kinase n=1 Tax=Sphingomonas sp. R86521 TaxID=3093860 RepID=UPI0036D2F167